MTNGILTLSVNQKPDGLDRLVGEERRDASDKGAQGVSPKNKE